MPALALGTRDDRDRIWLLARGPGTYSLMRTPDPLAAWTWPSEVELRAWLDSLPEAARSMLADRNLTIYPVEARIGEPIGSLLIETVKPATKGEPAVRETKLSRNKEGRSLIS